MGLFGSKFKIKLKINPLGSGGEKALDVAATVLGVVAMAVPDPISSILRAVQAVLIGIGDAVDEDSDSGAKITTKEAAEIADAMLHALMETGVVVDDD